MGRKKGSSSKRKPKVQLEDSKKVDNSCAASNFDYAQMTGSSAGKSKVESQSDEGTQSTTDQSASENGTMATKLAGFLKEIYELGTGDEGEPPLENGQPQSSTSEHSAMETSSGETDSAKVSFGGGEGMPIQQNLGGSSQAQSSSEDSQVEVTFWQEVMDPNTNHAYYWNPETNEVTWTLPANGVITSEVAGDTDDSGMGIGQGGMEMENDSGSKPTQKTNSERASAQKGSEKVLATKKVAKTADIDMFECHSTEESTAKKPQASRSVEDSVQVTVAVAAQEKEGSSSKKRKASPEPSDPVGDKKPSGNVILEQSVKKPRLAVPSSSGGGGISAAALGGVSQTGTPPVSKQEEQMLRFQVSNFADELSRKLQYLHVSSEGLSDLQILQVQLQTRLTDWKEGGLSSKYMLSKLKHFNSNLETYERSSAPEGWKFVWDSSTCRYKFNNLSTGESSWSYPMLEGPTLAVVAPKEEIGPRAEIAPTKEEEVVKRESEERRSQEDATMEVEKREVDSEQQPRRLVGPAKPVQPAPIGAPPDEVAETTASQALQQKPTKLVEPVLQTSAKIVTPTSTQSSSATAAAVTVAPAGEVKGQKVSTYQTPTAQYLRAPDGPAVLPVSRFQKRMEEKQAELDNPVEGWNLSVKDVRKILGRKHRHRHSAMNDDVVREGDYPEDDEEDEDGEVGGAREVASGGEGRPTKEPIDEFPISSHRTRSSTSSHSRRQQEHRHHDDRHHRHDDRRRYHDDHRGQRRSTSIAATVSPVIGISPVMLAAAAASVDPSSRVAPPGPNAPPTGPPLPTNQKQAPPPIPQPTALPPPHLKTPVTMVISRDPRVAKRQQQQLLEKTQGSTSQQAEVSIGTKTGADSKSPSPAIESSPQKSSETDEARMRERLLLRQKYRIRKASDRRDSKDDSPEDVQQSPTSVNPSQIKSCLVKSSSDAPTNVNATTMDEPDAVQPVHQERVTATGSNSNEQEAGLRPPPPRQQVFGSSFHEESVEQSTGELELGPHKKAVLIFSENAPPVDVTSLPLDVQSEARTSTTHEVLPDSRVEPETGEVESMNTTSSQVPRQAPLGTGPSVAKEETMPATAEVPSGQAKPESQAQAESDDDEKDDSSDSSDEDNKESEGRSKRAGGVPIGKCYMDQEGAEEEEGVASDREAQEEESDQSDQDRYSSSRRKRRHRSSRSRSRSRSHESRHRSSKRSRRRRHDDDRSDYSGDERSRSRRYDDDRSDYSDENVEDFRSSSHHRSSRRSSKYSRKYGSSSSSSKYSRHGSRKHRRSRSRDSRERDYGDERRGGRDWDRDRSSGGGSSKHKKKDKKEKKKKRRKSPRGGSGSGDDKNKPQPNILVGKIGKVGSVRTLGQDKKPSESEEGETQNSVTNNQATNQTTAADDSNSNTQLTQYQQQQYAGYYQQHPSTGQMPYYGSTTSTSGSYQDYMYGGYSQDAYNQQAAWQTWQQQQQAGGQGGGGQQTWGASTTGGGGQQQQQYVAYPIAGMGGGAAAAGAPPLPPPTTSVATPTTTDAPDGGSVQVIEEILQSRKEENSQPLPLPPPLPPPPSGPSEDAAQSQQDSDARHPPPPDNAPPAPGVASPPPTVVDAESTGPTATVPTPAPPPPPPPEVSIAGVEMKDGTKTPPVAEVTTRAMEEEPENKEDRNKEEVGGEEIMECDMEIEDDSPEASMMEEATPPVEPPVPVPPLTGAVDEGQKVDQPLPPTSQEGETKAENEEPLPPGVDDDEPLPPGTEISSGTKVSSGSAESVTQQEPTASSETVESVPAIDSGIDQQGQSLANTLSMEPATMASTGLQSEAGTVTIPPVTAIAQSTAAYSVYSAASSQGAPTSYAMASSTTASYVAQPGAAQYSYPYGQGYGNYAAYAGAYTAAYGGYPGHYYPTAAYGSYPYAATGYYGAATGAYPAPYQQQATSQATTSAPTSTANKEKPPPKVMMEQWAAFQEAATKKQ